MSIKAMTRVWDNSKLKGSALLLLVALADNADDDGICWPGINFLAGKIRMSARQVKRLLDMAERRGEIFQRIGNGRGNKTLYFVTAGLSKSEISGTLYAQFDMVQSEAYELANVIVNAQKGDKLSTDEKVTQLCPKKGDIFESDKQADLPQQQTQNDQKPETTTVIEPSESSDLSLSTVKDSESRAVEILPEKISEANSKRGEVSPVGQPSLFASSESASPVKIPPVGFKFVTGTNLSEPLHLRRENQTVMAQCLCKAKFPFRLNPVGDMLRGKPICEECLKIASTPKPERARKERKSNPWDAWGEAIATHLFGAKDKAGVNAVFGRVAPILHGDKRSGNCDGLIAYESERQGKDKADLDYAKLATDTAEFWKWHQRVKPTVKELKVCFKVVDAWQEWRGKQKPALDMSQYTIIEPDNYISPTPAR